MFVGKTCLFTILSMYLYQLRLDCAWTALGSLAPRPYARTCFQPTRWAPSGETHPIPMDKNKKKFPIEMAIWRYLLVSDSTYIILLILTRISHFFPIFLGVLWYQTWIFGSAIFQGSSLDIPWTKSSSACRSTSTSEANSKKEWRHWNQMSNGFLKNTGIYGYIYIYGINVYKYIYIYMYTRCNDIL